MKKWNKLVLQAVMAGLFVAPVGFTVQSAYATEAIVQTNTTKIDNFINQLKKIQAAMNTTELNSVKAARDFLKQDQETGNRAVEQEFRAAFKANGLNETTVGTDGIKFLTEVFRTAAYTNSANEQAHRDYLLNLYTSSSFKFNPDVILDYLVNVQKKVEATSDLTESNYQLKLLVALDYAMNDTVKAELNKIGLTSTTQLVGLVEDLETVVENHVQLKQGQAAFKTATVRYVKSLQPAPYEPGNDGVTPTPSVPPVTVPVEGTQIPAKVEKQQEKEADGTTVNVFKVDAAALLSSINKDSSAKAIIVPVTTDGGKAKVVVPAALLKQAAANNANSSVVMQADGVAYVLPVGLLNSSAIAQLLGVDSATADSANVNLVISEKPNTAGDDAASKTGGQRVSKVVEFSVLVNQGDKTAELNNFHGQYVTRSFSVDSTVDASKSVGVMINKDGSVTPVPTEFTTVNGKKVAVVKVDHNSAYTVLKNEKSFSDIKGMWAEQDIQLLGNKLLVSGYGDGTFQPNNDVTRAEFITMIARGLGMLPAQGASDFADVTSGTWFAGYLQAAAEAGLVAGFEDGTFRGNDKISRQDAVALLARSIGYLKLNSKSEADVNAALQAFSDKAEISDYAKQAVGLATALKVVSGNGDGTFNAQGTATRAETVIMVENLLKLANFLSSK
jgi:hypothetical protein